MYSHKHRPEVCRIIAHPCTIKDRQPPTLAHSNLSFPTMDYPIFNIALKLSELHIELRNSSQVLYPSVVFYNEEKFRVSSPFLSFAGVEDIGEIRKRSVASKNLFSIHHRIY